LLVFLPYLLLAQEPKREMRAMWVCTVSNLDWPKPAHRNNYEAQRADLIAMLDEYKEARINAILLQVRPECDAIYYSAYEPWSRFLSTTQGTEPDYDPLQFAIEEGHKRGIEVHAWLNPYRINASASDGGDYYAPNHVYVEHPEWAIEYDNGKKILNPGLPEVMSYIGDVVEDIAANYNVDGFHFDDYFYSYDGTPSTLDAEEYALYGNGMSLGDWRRDNVNRLMDTVYARIQKANPNARFGVSPFGIYRPGIPEGISGMDAWATIYCDPLAWLEDGSIDYLTPQLYWPTGGNKDFETLCEWWADQVTAHNRQLFPGMGIYRITTSKSDYTSKTNEDLHELKAYYDTDFYSPLEQNFLKGTDDPVSDWTNEEAGKQIDIIRSNNYRNALGSSFFRALFLSSTPGLEDYLNENYYTHATLVPEMTWKSGSAPVAPQNLRIELSGGEYYLYWDHSPSRNDRYAIYVTTLEGLTPEEIIADPQNLQAVTYLQSINLEELVISETAAITVTAVSASGKESEPSAVIVPDRQEPYVDIIAPDDNTVVSRTKQLQWTSTGGTEFQIQIAKNSSFSAVVYSSDWTTATAFDVSEARLEGESLFYWRVRAKNETSTGSYCGARRIITGYPATPELLTPANLAGNVDTKPLISWNASTAAQNIRIRISENNTFNPLVADELVAAQPTEVLLSSTLNKETWYYISIAGENSYGIGNFTTYSTFKTTSGEIPYVELLAPANLSTAASFDFLEWQTTATSGTISYQLEVSTEADFISPIYNSGWISGTSMKIEDMNLEGERAYYWHVKGKSEFGESYYTDPWGFLAGYPTRPAITEPGNLTNNISPRLRVSWTTDENTDSVYVEIAESSSFETLSHSETFPLGNGIDTISKSLKPFTQYYIQIKAVNEYGKGIASKRHTFETGASTGLETIPDCMQRIAVYPTIINNSKVYIDYDINTTSIKAINILDISGKLLHIEKTESTASGIELFLPDQVKNAVYFIQIQTDSGVVCRKIIMLN